MPTNRVQRLKKRQQARQAAREERGAPPLVSALAGIEPSTIEGDLFSRIEALYEPQMQLAQTPVEVDIHEVKQLLADVHAQWDEHQLSLLLDSCGKQVIRSVLVPFGLGGLAADGRLGGSADKDGGNISTVHNAQAGTFANKEDAARYHAPYERELYNKGFKPQRKAALQDAADTGEPLRDWMTGQTLPNDGSAHLDHKVSAKEYHSGRGDDDFAGQLRRLTIDPEDRAAMANQSENLGWAHRSANQSKGEHDYKAWLEKTKDGERNAERYGAGTEESLKEYEKARQAELTGTFVGAGKQYATWIATTGAQEAAKMGLQQAIGVVLCEFVTASFDQILDVYRHGLRNGGPNEGFFDALRRRLAEVVTRVASKWQGVVEAFTEGALSGFLSNLATLIINCLIKTGKQMVRVIREGFFSILRAFKLALFPPEDMSREEALDAAIKLLATGVVTGLGILAEEAIEKAVTGFFGACFPPLAPFAGLVSGVVMGALSGIISAVLVYSIDQLDLLGVQGERKHAFVMSELERQSAASLAEIDLLFDEIIKPVPWMQVSTT
jgi:hypothetical protein